jgi:Domain of unknown function (DUF1707)
MSPELRIGDAERDAAIAALSEHFAAGRLSKDEFDERTEAAWAARTAGALAPLFVDLPAPHAPASSAVSTTPALTRTGSARSSSRAFRRREGRFPIATLPVTALLVALLVADRIPWFVVAIVAWMWCISRFHGPWRHSWQRSRHQ